MSFSPQPDLQTLFFSLYYAKTEDEVEEVVSKYPDIFRPSNWIPLGGDEKMFGIIRNQQSNPIAALVEKVTNSIDAVLLKRCYEMGIDPKSKQAPKSMDAAINQFYPDHKKWDAKSFRRKQAEEIQIVADGPPRNTSVIIYDNGEGQHPHEFENTFLSLVRGNKIDIHFVQGKYNMGGSGALVFCGKRRYQLIGSKRFDGTGKFGFTLIRHHKSKEHDGERRYSFFEYFKIESAIPAFDCQELDLKLFGRMFKTGSVIKMYSYQFPSGYSGFAQDLNQSLNELLFEPVLPVLTVDKKERYPRNNVLELDLFGLKRRLEEEKNDYVDLFFSEEHEDQLFGKAKVTCYLLKPRVGDRDVKKTREVIRERFFRHNKAVLFSINGQVQGGFTSEFITRTLQFNMLKDYLLIHVDCTAMDADFREELFMASRDRLKDGPESFDLRAYLGKKLRKSQLEDINRRRKESIDIDSEDTNELIKSFAKNLPKDSDLFKLLQNTLKLEEKKQKDKNNTTPPQKEYKQTEKVPFNPNRFPSFFKLRNGAEGDRSAIAVPQDGEKVIKFDTDVENEYFDRTEEPGHLEIALLTVKSKEMEGGDRKVTTAEIGDLLNIIKSSPSEGVIKIAFNPTDELKVGDDVKVKVSLTGNADPFEEILWIKVKEKEAPKVEAPKEEESIDNIGLPEMKAVRESEWSQLGDVGIEMTQDTVMYPVAQGNLLERIYINLDSRVHINFRNKQKSQDQIMLAEKRYISAVYFHALFLYMIAKKKNYKLSVTKDGNDEEKTVDEFIRDLFDSYYSDFLLNFGMEQLLNSMAD